SETDAAGVAYTATITLDGVQHPPTPLTTGPAPALRIRLNDTTPPPPPVIVPPPIPQVVLGNASITPSPSVASPASPEASLVIATSSSQTGGVEQPRIGSVSLFDSLPSRVLLSLSASPLGGVRGPTQELPGRFEQVTLPSLTPGLPESLARLVLVVGLLTAPGDITDGTDPAHPLPLDPDPDVEGVTRCLLLVSQQGQGIASTAGDAFQHVATEAVGVIDSSVFVLDHLFTRWTSSPVVSSALHQEEPRTVATAAPETPADLGEVKPELAPRDKELRSWWPPAAGFAWGGALAVALLTTRQISRRRKSLRRHEGL